MLRASDKNQPIPKKALHREKRRILRVQSKVKKIQAERDGSKESDRPKSSAREKSLKKKNRGGSESKNKKNSSKKDRQSTVQTEPLDSDDEKGSRKASIIPEEDMEGGSRD